MISGQASWGDALQFLGGLLGALVAVGLWLAERVREHSREKRDAKESRGDFRAVVIYATDDLLKQMNYADLSLRQFVADYENIRNIVPAAAATVQEAFLSRVKSKATEMSITIPVILAFSTDHARYLRPSENGQLAEIATSTRALNEQLWDLSTSPSVQSIGDRLDVVASEANLLYAKAEQFRASLEERGVVAGRRIEGGL